MANSAWLVLAVIAFNLLRAAGALASRFHATATTGTLRTQLIREGIIQISKLICPP